MQTERLRGNEELHLDDTRTQNFDRGTFDVDGIVLKILKLTYFHDDWNTEAHESCFCSASGSVDAEVEEAADASHE